MFKMPDASDITFFNDPDDDVPLPKSHLPPAIDINASTRDATPFYSRLDIPTATVAAGSRRSGRHLKPSARMRDADNACGLFKFRHEETCTVKRYRPSGTEENEDKNVHPGESSADELVPQPDVEDLDDTDDAKSENGAHSDADVRTNSLTVLMGGDAGEPAQKHTFRGGTSTLRTHIVRHKKTHFQVYKQRCDAASITMHPRAIPPGEEHLTATQTTLDANLIAKPPMFTKEGLLEYIMELVVTEDEAIQLIDKPAFRRLLQYARPSLTEKDIPHRTKLTDTIKSRAMTVVKTIKERLAVGWMMSDNASNNDTTMKELARAIDEDGSRWLAGPHRIRCNHKKICRAIYSGTDVDIDGLTAQLAALEHDPKAIVEDGYDVSNAIGKALALIDQIRKSPQARAFFKKSCEEEGVPCLERFLSLRLAVNRFTLLADESHEVPKLRKKSYSDFKLDRAD
ncbi:hypothetical protein EV702DRAFT_1201002 [Suillus placidus]|uniref:Uncharacterized protein n=1 Tax=Suillus placidus TaxID=48579 RepID=A0A9P6ZPG5_9AGAM|nr:hypothetical protein EV702DRAFT_1201002 [Suillus placidus]